MSLTPLHSSGEPGGSWCASCGSPIPAGHGACPVCGMPVEGAFDEDLKEPFSVGHVPKDEGKDDPAGLVSAIPPTPTGSDGDIAPSERRRHTRLVVLAAVASLVVVGGTALFITRPWDPNAYAIHATEDADTSMEGFPGERSHLSAQDRAEEERRQAALGEAEASMDALFGRLGELAGEVEASREEVEAYLERGYLLQDGAHTAEVVAISDELAQAQSDLESLELGDSEELSQRRNSLVVLVRYLRGAANVLVESWSVAAREDSEPNAVFDVRAALEGKLGERSYDEWMELFTNAYVR